MECLDKKILEQTKIEKYIALFSGIYLDRNKLIEIIRDLGFEIHFDENKWTFFCANSKKYRICGDGDSIHRYGDGGEFEHRTFLKSKKENILISRRFCSYIVSADDFESFYSFDGKDTYIFGEDSIARKISCKIKELA